MRELKKTSGFYRKTPDEFHKDEVLPHTGYHESGRKVVAVDFDGTLVFNKYPYITNPNLKLIDFIKNNRNKYTWILWTCRTGQQLRYAVDYMKNEHGIEFDFINSNIPTQIEKYGESRKIWADYYIDDKNVGLNIFFYLKS